MRRIVRISSNEEQQPGDRFPITDILVHSEADMLLVTAPSPAFRSLDSLEKGLSEKKVPFF